MNNLLPAVASLVSLTRFEIALNFSFLESPSSWNRIDSLVVTYPPADLMRYESREKWIISAKRTKAVHTVLIMNSLKKKTNAYIQGVFDLEAVHARNTISQNMDVIVVLEKVQGCLQHTHMGFNSEEDHRLDTLQFLLNLGHKHGELCLWKVDLGCREIQFRGGGAQGLGVL